MSMLYKILATLVLSFVLPVVVLGASAYFSMRHVERAATEASVGTLLRLEEQRLSELTRAGALDIENFVSIFQAQVESLREAFFLLQKNRGRIRPRAASDLYPGKEKAGLPGYGYVAAEFGAYADFDGKGEGSPWLPRKAVDRVRADPAFAAEISHQLHVLMMLNPVLAGLGRKHQGIIDLAWIVLASGATNAYPPYHYREVIRREPGIVDLDESQEDYVRLLNPQHNPARKTLWLEPYHDRFKGIWMTSCVAPLYEGDRFLGTVGLDILLPTITQKVRELKPGGQGYAFLVTPAGKLIASPDQGIRDLVQDRAYQQALRQTALPAAEQHWDRDSIEALSRASLAETPDAGLLGVIRAMGRGERSIQQVTLSGEKKLLSIAPVPSSGWSLGITLPIEEVVSLSRGVQGSIGQGPKLIVRNFLGFALLIVAVSILVGLLLHYQTIRPLSRLSAKLDRMSWDSLEFSPEHPPRRDEIGKLEESFCEMIRMIRKASDEITRKSGDLALVNEQIVQANQVLENEVRERKKAEAMLAELAKIQKLESVALLAAGIAHDFNNLLAGVLGQVSLVKATLSSGDQNHARLQEAEKAVGQARNLTEQLLTFSTGGSPVKKTVHLGDLLESTARFALRGSEVRCSFSLDPELWPVNIDDGQVSQVVSNLVLNAVQAMPSGGEIGVSAKNTELTSSGRLPLPPGRYVEIAISDQGVGIPEAHLSKIFDPFFTTKPKGTGLGLAASFSILKKHDGHIEVESREGVGSLFRFYLPAEQQDSVRTDQPSCRGLPTGKGRILIMDDEEMIRELLRGMLSFLGYDPVITSEGREAIETYRRELDAGQRFDAVILDLTVRGGLGGKEAIQDLLRLDPAVCAIVSSGYSHDPVMAEYRRYGFSAFIPKPYSVDALACTLKSVLAPQN